MDIRINLLPDHKKPYLSFSLIFLLAAAIVALSAMAAIDYVQLKRHEERLSDNIGEMRILYENVLQEWRQASEQIDESNFLIYYDMLATELNRYWHSPDPLLGELIRFLPSGARMENVKFHHHGDVNLLIRFVGKEEIADYLDRLDASSLVLFSELVSVNMDEAAHALAQFNLRLVTVTGGADG